MLVRAVAVVGCFAALSSAAACGDDSSSGGPLPIDGGLEGGDGSGAEGGSSGSGGSGGGTSPDGSGATGGSGGTPDAAGCATTSDCPSGQVCNRSTGICVECVVDGDCGTGDRCLNSVCEPVITACVSRSDCTTPEKPACDTTLGICVQCVLQNDCAPSHDCTDNTCVPYVPCATTADCPPGGVCDDSIGRCVQCLSDGDCGSGLTCVGKTLCVPRCNANVDCAQHGLFCNSLSGYCVECLRHEDCSEGRHCAGSCKADICTPGAQRCEQTAGRWSIATCDSVGASWGSRTNCALDQTCKQTGSTASCENRICVPSTSFCDSSTERVMQCSADGLSSALKEDCGANVCVAAVCKPVICTAGTRRCSGNQVLQCSAKGDAETATTCASTQYCDDVSKMCVAQVCTPNEPACNGTIATTCNANGSGYVTSQQDTNCALQGLFCVQGACTTQVCAPSTRFCQDGHVRLCNVDGTSSTPYATCTSTQYCDSTVSPAVCRARVCTPDQLTCNGNTVTMCNSTGSGYLTGGSDCGALFCVSGTCQDALFAENFEDGDYNGWTVLPGTYTSRSVTNTTAADGSAWSLMLTKSATSGTNDGLTRTFSPAIQPTRVSWWVRAAQTTQPVAYFHMHYSSTSTYVAWTYFTQYATISVTGSGTTYTRPYVANTWYHMEFRNMNWITRTFDWYLDGVLVQANIGMYSTGTSVARLDLFNYGNGTAYFDEIEVQ